MMRRHPDSTAEDHAGQIAVGRDVVRQVREAGLEAVREARKVARETARQARQNEREAVRRAREDVRQAHESMRATRAGERTRELGETNTRTRIQHIALDLFTENGYEATSLREIAERLGVTKAALYYHFKTKDEIIESLVEDRAVMIEGLIAWAEQQPRAPQMRREFLRRYADMLHEQGHHDLMRFFERNQSSMTQHKAGVIMHSRMITMLDLLTDRDAPLTEKIRSSLAIFALHCTWFTVRDPEITDDQRREAALEVALGLIE